MKRMRDGKRGRRMSDLIKREDAVREMALMLEDISADLCEDILTRFGYDTPQELATEAMSIIPSAERKGEWIESDTDGFICSACGSGYRNQPTCMGNPMFEYCPVCGARMKGAEDE